MTRVEAAIVDTLRRSGPCRLDDVVTSLSSCSWGEVFAAVDRMSRDGGVFLSQLGYSTYQLSLVPQSHPSSTSTQTAPSLGTMARPHASI